MSENEAKRSNIIKLHNHIYGPLDIIEFLNKDVSKLEHLIVIALYRDDDPIIIYNDPVNIPILCYAKALLETEIHDTINGEDDEEG